MKTLLIALAGTALASASITTGVFGAETVEAAGPFDKLKKKVKKAKKKAKEVEEVVDTVDAVATGGVGSGGPNTISGIRAERNARLKTPSRSYAGVAGPTPAKFANATQCANVGLGNAFVARGGNYTFQQGISTQKRSGLIDRRPVTPVSGCVFEGLGVGDVLYVEFDKAKYDKHSFRIQCVSYDGSEQQDNTSGPSVGGFGGKDIMLHSGNSTGYSPTASGTNSDRSNAYKKYMDGRGRTFTTFAFGSLHTDKAGTDFYCQWFDRDTGKSAVALTYRRGPRGT